MQVQIHTQKKIIRQGETLLIYADLLKVSGVTNLYFGRQIGRKERNKTNYNHTKHQDLLCGWVL